MKPNTQQLQNVVAALSSHADALSRATNNQPQAKVDALTAEANDLDNKVVAVLLAPPIPAPTGQLDFTKFKAAVTAFEADGRHTQADVDNVTNVLVVNQ